MRKQLLFMKTKVIKIGLIVVCLVVVSGEIVLRAYYGM